MSPIPAVKHISVADYLQAEDVSEVKHEYYAGEIFAMAGGSFPHNQIASNIMIDIGQFLKSRPCGIYGSDLKVHVKNKASFVYPDLTIICNGPQFYEDRNDIIINPSVIIEVLSPGTQNYDRGGKFMLYRQISSLQEYVLVSSTEVLVEKFSKRAVNEWVLTEYKSPDDAITIESINYGATLSMLYRDVDLENETNDAALH